MVEPPSLRGVDRVSETGGVFVPRFFIIYAHSSTAIAEPPRGGSLTHWFPFIYTPFDCAGRKTRPLRGYAEHRRRGGVGMPVGIHDQLVLFIY